MSARARMAAALALVAGLAAASLFVGVSDVSLSGILQGQDRDWLVLVESRIPRMLALVLSGASMAIAGLLTQIVIRNRIVTEVSRDQDIAEAVVADIDGPAGLACRTAFPARLRLLRGDR